MLEPEIAAFVERSQSFYPPGAEALSIAESRRRYDALCAAFTPPRPPGVTTTEYALDLPDRAVPLRLYQAGAPRGTVIYLHGGGFILGSLDSHDLVTARLAADTGAAVLAVDYRLAPEHPAPAAFEDCLAVARAALDGDLPGPVVLAGDSAGGCLSASVALALRDAPAARKIQGLALIYPCLGFEPALPAAVEEAGAPMLTLAEMRACREAYLAGRPPGPYDFALDHADLRGLPPTLALAAEHDPLRDDARLFVERLRAVRGVGEYWLGPGLVHGCLRAMRTSPTAAALYDRMVEFVKARLSAQEN
ncbi:alpha/beta hydrolase [Oleomonas cavernae]|uniref:Alpha/beta hydrolase n=1 Tax=Oleomonas cavernae TaxID=2320859 RepID=A0A418WU16_9PROT|nr:alpha/beta hydrolase [Oleomonas cavernae]RJF94752.1 alpha/beta hydrolase [Oleomonas cavernae]